MQKPVLIVEDDEMQSDMLVSLLQRKLEFSAHRAKDGRKALDILEREAEEIRLVILDIGLPVMSGLEVLEIISQKYPNIAVIMLTGSADIEDASKAMRLGAVDYLTKPYKGERMVVTVRNALKLSALSQEVNRLKSEKEGTFTLQNLIGYDHGLSKIVELARKAASSDIPVLITGETGTGKEVFAEAVHGESSRSGKSFITVNCGAIPSQLVESMLFGHEKGSFTGATEKTIGKFREAEGGTIFLDEVGELPLDMQVKLLRVLQQKEVEPVGATKAVPINVRILSATNRNLPEEVAGGRFREDLYFRLNVLQIELPPLRERKEDIPALCNHFVQRICTSEGRDLKTFSDELLEKMQNYDWPGNVRQLENAINRLVVVSDSNVIGLEDGRIFKEGMSAQEESKTAQHSLENNASSLTIDLLKPNGDMKSIDEVEQETMQKALSYYDDNITKASQAIGMAKSTFYKKLKSN